MGIYRPQEEGMALKKYIYEIKSARGESMTDEALMDMRKKLATAPGAHSSESTMIPPQIQGWLLLHRARMRHQHIVGVMTMTGGSLNIKLVGKSLFALRTLEIPESSTLLRQLKRFQRTMTTLVSKMTSAKTMIRASMKTETSLRIVFDIDDDSALDDEEHHEALLGNCEARELMKGYCCPHSFRQAYW